MYIISKNKDYYDGVVGSVGMDKTIVYERTINEITESNKMPKIFQYQKYSWNDKGSFLNVCRADVDKNKTNIYKKVSGFIVGFCGKLYLGWRFEYDVKEWDAILGRRVDITKTDIIYGYNEAKKYLKADYWRSNLDDDVKYVMDYDPINIFRDYRAPIFVYDIYRKDDTFIVNPILKDYEFYKVVDAFTAFTELQMFIGGVLGRGEKEIVEIEDKYKIGQHGFNKWSFRKEPSKKK